VDTTAGGERLLVLVVVLVPGLMHVGVTMRSGLALVFVLMLDVGMVMLGMQMHVRFAVMDLLTYMGSFVAMIRWHGSSSWLDTTAAW
jgi:hypothetical protein